MERRQVGNANPIGAQVEQPLRFAIDDSPRCTAVEQAAHVIGVALSSALDSVLASVGFWRTGVKVSAVALEA